MGTAPPGAAPDCARLLPEACFGIAMGGRAAAVPVTSYSSAVSAVRKAALVCSRSCGRCPCRDGRRRSTHGSASTSLIPSGNPNLHAAHTPRRSANPRRPASCQSKPAAQQSTHVDPYWVWSKYGIGSAAGARQAYVLGPTCAAALDPGLAGRHARAPAWSVLDEVCRAPTHRCVLSSHP